MFRSGLLLIYSFILLSGLTAQAETYRRLVNFEWEPIEGATTYDMELKLNKEADTASTEKETEPKKEKSFSFRTKEAAWNGKLAPGKYLMRLRARDYRGVPGDWSPFSDFNVGLDAAQLKSPAPKAKLTAKDDTEVQMPFAWERVGGASSYQFELTSDDGAVKISEEVKDTKWSGKIPVAKNYTWKVTAFNDKKIQSDATTVGEFSLVGKTLDAPKIETPESSFVREVKWQKPDHVDAFDVYIMKYNREQKKWEKFQSFEDYKDNVLPFQQAWPGGKYQAVIRAKGNLRGNSPLAKSGFDVHNGDRSPASEYTALVRKSIDRVTGWYGVASYLVTQIQFLGRNPENNSAVNYSALGGTGRLGAGWFSPTSPWGFLGIIDMSGFTFNGKTSTFASGELNAVYKQGVGDRGEYRIQMGGYYKELPETIGDPFSNSSVDTTIKAAGPHLGAEYWYSLSPKLGLQMNMHMYFSLFKLSTPNGQALSPTLSTQIGFLGSYRFTPTFTGLFGYARREDKLAYKADTTNTNFTNANAGDTNTTNISGNYINFLAEWSF